VDEEYITLRQAARLGGYKGSDTLHAAVRGGSLRAVKPDGGVLMTTRAWLEDYQRRVTVTQHRRAQRPPRESGASGEDEE